MLDLEQCPDCLDWVVNEAEHMLECPTDTGNRNFQCIKCEARFATHHEAETHVIRKHQIIFYYSEFVREKIEDHNNSQVISSAVNGYSLDDGYSTNPEDELEEGD